MNFYTGPNRYLCSVLEEMRSQLKVLDEHNVFRYKSAMSMLIEEAQTLANRMEAALDDWSDIRKAQEILKELRAEIKEIKK